MLVIWIRDILLCILETNRNITMVGRIYYIETCNVEILNIVKISGQAGYTVVVSNFMFDNLQNNTI